MVVERKVCLSCYKEFHKRKSCRIYNWIRQKYCSNACGHAGRSLVIRAKTTKICTGCHRELVKSDFHYYRERNRHASQCFGCIRVDARIRYRKNPKKRRGGPIRENPIKLHARKLLQSAVRYGKLKRMPCEKCGEVKVQGHHEDYSKPYDVQWLCRVHHGMAHWKPVDPACLRAMKPEAEGELGGKRD